MPVQNSDKRRSRSLEQVSDKTERRMSTEANPVSD